MFALLLVTVIAGHDLAADARVIDFFSDVYVHAGLSNRYAETAAFLVRDTAGDVQCLAWPLTNESRKESFSGAIPLQTIALVHSHPSMDRLPTAHDKDVARALHLPMIVLTQSNITLFDPDSNETTLIVDNRTWVPRRIAQHCEKDWLAR